MKPILLGYENGYIVDGKFQSNAPLTGEYQAVKVRVQVEHGKVVRDYRAANDRNYTRVINL